MACESYICQHFVDSVYFFLNVNIVAHLVIPAGWGSCPPRQAILILCFHLDILLRYCFFYPNKNIEMYFSYKLKGCCLVQWLIHLPSISEIKFLTLPCHGKLVVAAL